MGNRKKVALLIHVAILANLRLAAQTTKVVRDFRSRTALCVEKEICKELSVGGEAEIGFEQNLSYFEEVHGEVELKYDALKVPMYIPFLLKHSIDLTI